MTSQRIPIPNVLERPRWCTLIDPNGAGPLKRCLGLTDCNRCGFAQWLDLMDAAPPVRGPGSDIHVRSDLALAA